MKEKDYLEFAVIYENLADKYRALAESVKSQTDTKLEKNAETKEEQSVTFEVISALAKRKAAEGKSLEVKAIITEGGVKKLSDIPQELYAEVHKKLEAI